MKMRCTQQFVIVHVERVLSCNWWNRERIGAPPTGGLSPFYCPLHIKRLSCKFATSAANQSCCRSRQYVGGRFRFTILPLRGKEMRSRCEMSRSTCDWRKSHKATQSTLKKGIFSLRGAPLSSETLHLLERTLMEPLRSTSEKVTVVINQLAGSAGPNSSSGESLRHWSKDVVHYLSNKSAKNQLSYSWFISYFQQFKLQRPFRAPEYALEVKNIFWGGIFHVTLDHAIIKLSSCYSKDKIDKGHPSSYVMRLN